MSELLRASKLHHQFASRRKTVTPLRDVSLVVETGQVVAVRGRSGAGKTTLLLACGGLRRPTGGTVHLAGTNLYELPVGRRTAFRAAHVGFVFQTMELIPYLSLWENVMLVPGAQREQAERWIEQLSLQDRTKHRPKALSQGERQRAALARALVHHPRIILADEPTGNLDQDNTHNVFSALGKFAADGGGVLIATHDPSVFDIVSVVWQLESGVLSESDP